MKSHSIAIVGFNYKSLDQKAAKMAKLAARRSRQDLNQAASDIGRDLLKVKVNLNHGQFVAWLRGEFDLSVRTAQRYMAAAQLVAKSETVSRLKPSVLYQLSAPSTPPAVQDEILRRVAAGEEISIADIVAAHKELQASEAKKSKGPKQLHEGKVITKPRAKAKPRMSDRSDVAAVDVNTPYIRMKTEVGRKLVQRKAPADQRYFWVRIKREHDYLLICEVRKSPPR